MIAQDALDLVRGVLFEVMVIAGPVLLIAMVVGLIL
jgi:flagellar biosynthesis protein FliQ